MNKPAAKTIMPMIGVESVDEVRHFYVDALGFDHMMGMVGKDGKLDFCTVVKDGARLMFSRNLFSRSHGKTASGKTGSDKQPIEIYIEVADIVAYHDQLRKKTSVKITDPLTLQWWGDKTFKVLDPCGYEIWFYQTVGEIKPPEGAKIV
ncbi:MAG: VOC family protein [Gammaproteobacteria bacterium]|nr:VOC family protein [Gammaproteobacteria bacterium]